MALGLGLCHNMLVLNAFQGASVVFLAFQMDGHFSLLKFNERLLKNTLYVWTRTE